MSETFNSQLAACYRHIKQNQVINIPHSVNQNSPNFLKIYFTEIEQAFF